MGRNSQLAKSCRTCIERKVKCDRIKPECFRCQSSGRFCAGYSGLTITRSKNLVIRPSSLLKCNDESLAARQTQKQLISQFLDDYLPPQASGSVPFQSPLYWAETFSTFLDSQSTFVNVSLSALTLTHLAKLHRDDSLAHRGRHYYSLAVQKICALNRPEQFTDLIRTSMILALYEAYKHPQGHKNAWQVHVQAAYSLMQASGVTHHVLNRHDLRRLFTVEFLRVCINGQSMACLNFELQTDSSADMFDWLLKILSETVHLLGTLRQTSVDGELDKTCAENLLQESVYQEGRLLNWFHELQSKDSDQPLFFTRSPTYVCVDENTFETIYFTNPSCIPLLLLYWLGLVIVYSSMTRSLCVLARLGKETCSENLQQRLQTAEGLCYRFTKRISQCYAGCEGMGRGTVILVAATSLAAQRICPGRQDEPSIIQDNNF